MIRPLCGAFREFWSRLRHNGGAHSAPARERRGGQGSPQATEPGYGAEPHVGKWKALLSLAFGVAVLTFVAARAQQQRANPSSDATALTALDYLEIQQLVTRYAYALDSGADGGRLYAGLFAPDGVFVQRSGEAVSGRDALASLAVRIARPKAEHYLALLRAIPYKLTPSGRPAEVEASRKLLERHGLQAGDIDLWEINEAFAGVVVASCAVLGIDPERVNVNGGAVALGHPLAASGMRLVLTLAYEMRRRGAQLGVATLCGGGGQGEALLLRR